MDFILLIQYNVGPENTLPVEEQRRNKACVIAVTTCLFIGLKLTGYQLKQTCHM